MLCHAPTTTTEFVADIPATVFPSWNPKIRFMDLPPSLQTYASRTDLGRYGDNGLLLFALELAFTIEDIDAVASLALTDGPDDKKCDLVYVDHNTGRVIIAQAYLSQNDKPAAPSGKASDLNTAVGWLLGSEPDSLPVGLRAARDELDSALNDNEVRRIELWYVHNLPESKNVQDELTVARSTALAVLEHNYPHVTTVDSVAVQEVGRELLERWYNASQVAILVTEDLEVDVDGGFEEEGDRWAAFCTSVPATWLVATFQRFGTDLFSANVRDYLGSINSDANINNNIKKTASELPARFFAYNNGLTALVNEFEIPGADRKLRLSGMSIVNGAQTTGALSSSNADPGALDQARVLARFVKCADQGVIRDIIEYNNSQNKVEAADFRSNDAIQDQLRQEFSLIPDADYRGGRRGSEKDIIERPTNLVPTQTVAQALASFHGEPNTAYNETRRIWSSDEVYARTFPEFVSARHALFCYTLLKAIDEAKFGLMVIPPDKRTRAQAELAEFFRKRGSAFLLTSAVASCLETILDSAVPDPWTLRFDQNLDPRQAVELWQIVLGPLLSLAPQLETALEVNLKNRDRVTEAIQRFAALVDATRSALGSGPYAEFAAQVRQANP